MFKQRLILTAAILMLLAGGGFYYYGVGMVSPPDTVVSTPASVAAKTTLVLASPPRETPEEGELIYRPIAEYLSKVTGKRVVYKHPRTWGVYRTEMLNGGYDIVFDGGHFAGYRALMLNHNVVAKVPAPQQFVVIVRKNENVTDMAELAGETFCSPPQPNQGALVALSQFNNPAEQPVIVPVTGNFWPAVYNGVVDGHCKAGVIVLSNLEKLDKVGATKIVFKAPPQPNQAFTVGPRISPQDRMRIADALTSSEAAKPTEKLRERFQIGDRLVAATNEEYVALAELLRKEWGFYQENPGTWMSTSR